MNIDMFLEMAAGSFGDRPAITDDGESYTAAELLSCAQALGSALAERGDYGAILYIGPHGAKFATVLFACATAGVPFVPLNYRLSEEQLERFAARHPDALIIAEPSVAAACPNDRFDLDRVLSVPAPARSLASPQDAEMLAVILYTSGTSAEPKGVALRHRHLTSYVLNTVEFASARPEEAALVAVPPYHIAGIANLLTNLFAGRRSVFLHRFTPEAWLETALRERVTQAMVVPTMLARLAEHLETTGESAPPSLRLLAYGGAKTSPTVLRRALQVFPDVSFVHAYGLTETTSSIAVLGPEDHDAARRGEPEAVARLASVGRVVPSVEVKIADGNGMPVPWGETGEILVRGPQVSGEYVDAAGKRSDWFATRDLGRIDADGYLYVLGRADDTIIRGGENIAPAEIESVLHEHPAVREVGVVGVPSETWGEEVGAAVVLRPGANVEDLRQWAQQKLRTSKAPSHYIVLEALPHSETGKLVRRELVNLFSGERMT